MLISLLKIKIFEKKFSAIIRFLSRPREQSTGNADQEKKIRLISLLSKWTGSSTQRTSI